MQKTTIKEIFRAIKFTLISVSAGLVEIGSFSLMNEVFRWNYWVSYLIALLLSVIWNFTINRKYTFKSANNVRIAMLLVLAFYAVFTPVSTVLGELAEQKGANEYLVLGVTMAANLITAFLFTRFVVYRHSCDTAPGARAKEERAARSSEEKASGVKSAAEDSDEDAAAERATEAAGEDFSEKH